ncbi:uncharacterized protein LOC126905465 [Daktulosphaira vitifoliae]|uniref:uncharacterized protein LOC126905465 n=1 Tax=Daktulosphaira vitifoliae TaxID=58002 RepID=UPI0021AA9574|nr:uncharacterized protein LOC126905465 [Daktulosphaira vitifoliae]
MLYYFYTVHPHFNQIVSHTQVDINKIKEFEEKIKSMGSIVLSMLENIYYDHLNNLKKTHLNKSKSNISGPYSYVYGLVLVNLYLNNMFDTLKIKTFNDIEIKNDDEELNEYDIFIKEFKKIYDDIIFVLNHSVNEECFKNNKSLEVPDSFCYDECVPNDLPEYEYLNELLPELDFYERKKARAMKLLDKTREELNIYLSVKPERELEAVKKVQNNFHPSKILLSGLFIDKRNESEKDLLTGSVDPMYLLYNVQVNEKLVNGNFANIAVLYKMIQRYYDLFCVMEFQKQIFAATIHPLYLWVGSYAQIVKHILFNKVKYPNENTKRAETHATQLIEISRSVQTLIKNLMDLKILPDSCDTHLQETLSQVAKFSSIDYIFELKLEDVDELYTRCAKAMEINRLKFNSEINSLETYNNENCDNILERLKSKYVELNIYVDNLSLYKEDYNYILQPSTKLFDFEDIFTRTNSCNIVDKNKNGFHLFGKN